MCDYCDEDNIEDNLRGIDGICCDSDKGKHYLYIEHFRNEVYRIEVDYCPKCGENLHSPKSS